MQSEKQTGRRTKKSSDIPTGISEGDKLYKIPVAVAGGISFSRFALRSPLETCLLWPPFPRQILNSLHAVWRLQCHVWESDLGESVRFGGWVLYIWGGFLWDLGSEIKDLRREGNAINQCQSLLQNLQSQKVWNVRWVPDILCSLRSKETRWRTRYRTTSRYNKFQKI